MATSDFDEFCRSAFAFLAARKIRFLVIGGLAVAAVGEPRLTGDVDVIAFVSLEEAEELIAAGAAHGFEVDVSLERRRLQETHTLRFGRGYFQLDLILASLPFEEAAFARSTKRRLFGHLVPLPSAEDLILLKVLAGRDNDLLDA